MTLNSSVNTSPGLMDGTSQVPPVIGDPVGVNVVPGSAVAEPGR